MREVLGKVRGYIQVGRGLAGQVWMSWFREGDAEVEMIFLFFVLFWMDGSFVRFTTFLKGLGYTIIRHF